MKMLKYALLFAILPLAGCSADAEKAQVSLVQQWEYKIFTTDEILAVWSKAVKEKGEKSAYGVLEEELNKLGKKGWELVTVAKDGAFIFKRPKKKDRES